MINVTRWHPDTCDCIIDYSWDTDLPADQRVHILSQTVRKCEVHQDLDGTDHYAAVRKENMSKNIYISAIKDVYADANVDWSFDDKRKLVLDVKSASTIDVAILMDKIGADVKINVV